MLSPEHGTDSKYKSKTHFSVFLPELSRCFKNSETQQPGNALPYDLTVITRVSPSQPPVVRSAVCLRTVSRVFSTALPEVLQWAMLRTLAKFYDFPLYINFTGVFFYTLCAIKYILVAIKNYISICSPLPGYSIAEGRLAVHKVLCEF